MLGMIHIAQGVGPHPTILLLHGILGYERNFDLAQTHVTLDSDHAFTNKRVALARTVIEWLKNR